MSTEYTELEAKIQGAKQEILIQRGRKEQIHRYLNELRRCGDILEEFDMDLWNMAVESATITADSILTFLFRDGTKIPVHLPKKK